MDSIVETTCDRGWDPPPSPAAARNVEGLQCAAFASHLVPLPGSDSSVYSRQHTGTVGHMILSVVKIVYKSEVDSCKVSYQHLQPPIDTSSLLLIPPALSIFSNLLIMRFSSILSVIAVSAVALVGAAPTPQNGIDINAALIDLGRRSSHQCVGGQCVRAVNDIVNVVDRCNSALAVVPAGLCGNEDTGALLDFTMVSLGKFPSSDIPHSRPSQEIAAGLNQHQSDCSDNC